MSHFFIKQKSDQINRFFVLVPRAGIEPARYCYHGILSPARLPIPPPRPIRRFYKKNGAGDGTRTRDLNLGKVALYQLSYSRKCSRPIQLPDYQTTKQIC